MKRRIKSAQSILWVLLLILSASCSKDEIYNPQNEKTIFPKRKRKVRSRKDQNESVQFPDTRTKIKQRLSALQMVFKRCFFL